ncbi:MAG TPA: hypothetical protein V6C88_07660 [Chroococcidiopsis sp.]
MQIRAPINALIDALINALINAPIDTQKYRLSSSQPYPAQITHGC